MPAPTHQISTPGTLKGVVIVFPDLIDTSDTISSVAESGDAGLTVSATVGAGTVTHERISYTAGKYLTVDIVAASGMTPGAFNWQVTYTSAAGEILTYTKELDVVSGIPIGD